MREAIRGFGEGILDLVFPPRCLLCDALAEPFCGDCRAQIRPVGSPGPPPRIEGAGCVGWHDGPLREAVLRLKWGRKVALARPLGELLQRELAPVLGAWQPEVLVPVPIHWTRRWSRGFNQAELLAEELGREAGLPVLTSLKKVRATPPQVGLNAQERARNLRGAFALDPRRSIRGYRVVLIDDVRTTGATLAECAGVLKGGGAAAVFALTVTQD